MKGYTLIELMLVVAIIGILAAIIVPAFSEYQLANTCTTLECTSDKVGNLP